MFRNFKSITITVVLFVMVFTNSIVYANDEWNNGAGVKEILYETALIGEGSYRKVALKEDGTLWKLQQISEYEIVDLKTPSIKIF